MSNISGNRRELFNGHWTCWDNIQYSTQTNLVEISISSLSFSFPYSSRSVSFLFNSLALSISLSFFNSLSSYPHYFLCIEISVFASIFSTSINFHLGFPNDISLLEIFFLSRGKSLALYAPSNGLTAILQFSYNFTDDSAILCQLTYCSRQFETSEAWPFFLDSVNINVISQSLGDRDFSKFPYLFIHWHLVYL